jgi:hypothetical protein
LFEERDKLFAEQDESIEERDELFCRARRVDVEQDESIEEQAGLSLLSDEAAGDFK